MLRYERNIRLEGFGENGQQKLMNSTAVVIGAGGLGSPAIYYLAASGVGTIKIVDGDKLEVSNLNRQILHNTDFLGKDKTVSANNTIKKFNPDCKVITKNIRINALNISEIIADTDVVLDCTDNFKSRFIIADACWENNKFLCYASAQGYNGQLLVQSPSPTNPCYRCLIPEIPPQGAIPHPATTGVLGSVVGTMGSMQATEAIKYLLGMTTSLDREMLAYDGLRTNFTKIKREKNKNCKLCGI